MTSVVVADAGLGAGGRERPVQVLVAAAALVAVGSVFPLPVGRITVALVAALLLAPVTVPTTWRLTRWARGFILLTAAAMVWGVWLAVRPGLRVGDTGRAREDLFLMATLLLGTCVVVWARTLLRDEWVAGLFGVGLLVHGATAGGQFASNPWKFGFALPVAVILLSLAWAGRSWKLEVVLLVTLAFVSAITDSRSGFALLALTALLMIWSQRPRVGSRRRWVGSFLLLGVAFVGTYKLAEALIVDGYFGQATQLRTEAQIQAGSSLILGSRPELGATLALMRAHPMGFGVGENPTPGDVEVAKSGMAAIGYDPNNGYVEHYMFGSGFEVHSMFGDLWAHCGLVGLALAAYLLTFVVRGIARGVALSTIPAVVLYAGLTMTRDLLFSPVGTSVPLAMLFLGLMIVPAVRSTRRGTP